ncbi:MAG TPA: 30S ribosomal protein S21 [Ktedonobacteraceae bacterium]|nr:30S ribosomal protein S21 [Ktedonobacteraceae bacterium]
MCQIIVNPNVPFDVVLKQFNRKVQDAGILGEARRRRHFESPQARRKRKAAAQLRKRKRAHF